VAGARVQLSGLGMTGAMKVAVVINFTGPHPLWREDMSVKIPDPKLKEIR